MVLDKLSGELAQGDHTGDEDILVRGKRYLAEKYNKPGNVFLGLPHRLDRPTSGVLVLCKTGKALSRVSMDFKARDTKKIYHCLVQGKPAKPAGDLQHYLAKNAKNNKSFVVGKDDKDSKLASLSYRTIQVFDYYTLLEIQLHTGRHHQIRAQLSALKHPIKGDVKYGAKRGNRDGSICLHAYELTMKHPTKKELISFVSQMDYLKKWGM